MKKVFGIISALTLLSGWLWGSKERFFDTAEKIYAPNTGTTPVIIFVALGVIAIAVFIFIRRRK